jgi:hypothetical protein
MDNGVVEGSCPSLALGAESCIAETLGALQDAQVILRSVHRKSPQLTNVSLSDHNDTFHHLMIIIPAERPKRLKTPTTSASVRLQRTTVPQKTKISGFGPSRMSLLERRRVRFQHAFVSREMENVLSSHVSRGRVSLGIQGIPADRVLVTAFSIHMTALVLILEM